MKNQQVKKIEKVASAFLPMFLEEVKLKGWDTLDVIIVTGDAYVDHPSYGAAVIGRLLESHGFRVGVIAQPNWQKVDDFRRLGRPRLCFCVTAGNVDSMIANYTANKKRRREDDYSPGGESGLRPDRASIAYTIRVKEAFKGVPVILGGVEASMRRLAHYDYWDDQPRRSLLIDTKADLLIYGMGERPIVEVINRLKQGEDIRSIQNVSGTVVHIKPEDIPSLAIHLPSFEEVKASFQDFNLAFKIAYENMNLTVAKPLVQKHGQQYVLHLPPQLPLKTEELDRVYELPFVRAWHPSYDARGGVKGFEIVRWSITALRGCPGECSFCGLSMHQGRIVQSRSEESILKEARLLAAQPDFKGTITDIGGPTANLYAAFCQQWDKNHPCPKKQCLMPQKCSSLKLGYNRALALYEKIQKIPKVKHVFISSGLRYDLLIGPEAEKYLKQICEHHISGQMKIAPEHTDERILKLMNKPPYTRYEEFVRQFEKINERLDSRKYLVNYFISSHPGSRLEDACDFGLTLLSRHIRPEQIQDFLPLPMTVSGCIYYTGEHPLTGQKVFVPKKVNERSMQRALLQSQNPENRSLIRKALQILGREDLFNRFGSWR